MISLDNLLHEAECLERGSRGGSESAIGLNQLSKFFNQVSQEQETTLDGRVLLAQQGIDSAKTESLLKDMQTSQKTEESLSLVATQKIRHPKMSAYTAIEEFEMLKQDFNEQRRKQYREEMLSFFGNTKVSKNPISSDFKLFPTDPQQLGKLSEYAQFFANYQINPDVEPFSSPKTIINQSIEAISESHSIDESTRVMRSDFFGALYSILCREGLPEDLSQYEYSTDQLREMICGSLDFLANQYRNLNFPNDLEITAEEVDNFVLANYPDVQPPWPQIWVCIRSGLFDLVQTFCKNHRRETAEFWHYFNLFVLQDNEPTSEIQSNVLINTKPTNEFEAIRTFCYIFVIGEDLQQPPDTYLKKAEDFIYLLLSPYRYSTSSLNTDGGYSALSELQQLISFESGKIFKDGNDRFVSSMHMATILKFDICAKSLIENKLFPVEVLHILIILYKAGLLKQDFAVNILPSIINEFVNLLPLTMTNQIVDYLSLVDDRKYLIKFLLSLDINEYSVNLNSESKQKAREMVEAEINSNEISYNSLYLFMVTLEYDNACKLVTAISSDISSSFTLVEMSETILICSKLLKLNQLPIDETTIVNLENAALKISEHVLALSDELTQSEKERLLFNVEQLRNELIINRKYSSEEFSFKNDSESIEKVTMLYKLLHILVLFDSGRSDMAISEALREKQIIPFSDQDLEDAITWIDNNSLSSASLITTTIIRFLSFYMDTNQKNGDIITILFEFCSRIPVLSEEANMKLLELHENYERFVRF